MTSLSLFSQEETFRKYYGLPYAWAEEKGFSIEQTGEDAFVLIGTRGNAESLSTDIAFWTFGPTGGFIDSTVWALPKSERLLETFGGPDGGFLIVYASGYFNEQDTVNLAYFNADGTLSWNQPLADSDDLRDGIRGVDFVSPTEVVLVYASNLPESAPKVAKVSATEGLVPLFTYLNNGFAEIWSLERQSDGNLLMTGGSGEKVFVTLVTPTGEVVWEQVFKNAIEEPDGRAYEFLTSAHRPPGDTVIVVTGKRSGRRAFIIMDTVGNRLEEHLVPLGDFHEGERATWYGSEKVFINNAVDQYYQLIELENYIPTGTYVEESRYVDDFQLYGSFYIENRGIMLSALHDNGDQGVSRRNNSAQSVEIFKGGKPWYSANEKAQGIVVLSEGNLLVQTNNGFANGTANGGVGTSFWTTDSVGNLLSERMVINNRSTVVPTMDGNFLLHYRTYTEVVVIKADPSGNELWRAKPETDLFDFGVNVVVNLGHGQFAWSESDDVVGSDGHIYDRTRITHSDSTGVTLNSFYTDRTGEIFSMTLDRLGNLIVAGSSFTRKRGLIISYDLETGTENWRNTYQIPLFDYCTDTKLLSMPEGTIGVFSHIGRRGNNREGQLDFRKLDPADGTEVGQLVLQGGRFSAYSHQMAQRADGLVTLVYGYHVLGEEPPLLRVKEIDPVSMTLVNAFEFSNFHASVHSAGIAFIDTARTAVVATTYVQNMGLSEDVLLIVFNTEGVITDIRGQEALPLDITMSPNPTPDVLRITTSATAATGTLSVQVFDATGRQLLHKDMVELNQTELDLSSFTTGTYFVLVRDGQGRFASRKVVKQ